jgi:hypothetical protein
MINAAGWSSRDRIAPLINSWPTAAGTNPR